MDLSFADPKGWYDHDPVKLRESVLDLKRPEGIYIVRGKTIMMEAGQRSARKLQN